MVQVDTSDKKIATDSPVIFVGLSGEQFPQEGAKELTTGSPQSDGDDEARRWFGKSTVNS